ncbi:MAG: tRNA (N(6)-L-threonylcarbamoyladenosine(37)-C(2))-methylthiotransferase MtaB [Holosporaceae bacterium]|jgi:threonylcarbamoyladenosine tRNA methylthiotransferase MtaB|nr:tRNA (N(6)-L-threonylcarbamoyladenosine(37)-C(2))-methylthiotransferase MtaB [Holosporaceae bacterium]
MSSPINIITFGCRLNACESDLIKDFAKELGIVDDYTLINTCAVTMEAERKLCQTLRRLYSENPNIKIILTGCASELRPDFYIKMDGVVGIISNKAKLSKAEYLKYSSNKAVTSSPEHKKVRGFLQIQNGCDQKCTYCVVRLTRGSNVSFSEDEIVNQARKLIQKGYKELVLTGVNVSSYGRDLTPSKNLSFILRHLLKNVPEMTRWRLSSLDPADIDDDLIKLIGSEEKLLPHIHESIQSGDDMILKRMIRRHSRNQLIETNEKILQARPDVVFGADIIVGFPTETEEMFENTKKLLEDTHLSLLHIFPFSGRPGTPAAAMPKVEKKIITRRAKELRILADDVLDKKLTEQIGKSVPVLAEDDVNAKTNSFLDVKSLVPLEIGKEYLFHCESIDKHILIGYPVEER